MTKLQHGMLAAILLLLITFPVLAAPTKQSEGGIHLGPYTLSQGDTLTGDLVAAGPVTLERESFLDGKLVAFGAVTIEQDATVTGDVAVTGETTVAGTIEGNVFVAGDLYLQETAQVKGDVSVAGRLQRVEGAQIQGDITTLEEDDLSTKWHSSPMDQIGQAVVNIDRHPPRWLQALWRLFRDVLLALALTTVAFVLVSVWPQQMERMEDTLSELPFVTYGIGLASLIAAVMIVTLMTITICLAPFALLGYAIGGLVLLIGWSVLGTWLGRRILKNILQQATPSLLLSAIMGCGTLSLFTAFAGMIPPLRILLTLILFPLAAGVVALTGFGTHPAETPLHTTPPRHMEPIVPISWPTPSSQTPPPPSPAEDNIIHPFDAPPPQT